MNLRQIEVFRAVMLTGSVTGAARMLHVSQPGISRMLAHIELQIGVRLFERGRGQLRPTPEATVLYETVEQAYGGVSRIDDCARGLKAGERMTLRVLASPSTALSVVPRAIADVARQFPSARIYLDTRPAKDMALQLARQEVDVAISTIDIAQAPCHGDVVGAWSLVCVFPAEHRFAQRRTVTAKAVIEESLITFSDDTPQGRFIAAWCSQHATKAQTRLEVRSGQAACALVACSAGIAIVDNLTALAWRPLGLHARPISRGPRFTIQAVRNMHAPGSELSRAFVERVRWHLKDLASDPDRI